MVKLDRGFPLVRCEESGALVRCEHAAVLEKTARMRAVIGDYVSISLPEGHDKGLIEDIEPRSCELVRKDPVDRARPQVLAANFDRILLAQPVAELNVKRLERELVLACETGAKVSVVLTKADLAEDAQQVSAARDLVAAVAGDAEVFVVSPVDDASLDELRKLLKPGTTTVLLGRSGVGKSSLINALLGEELLETGAVRERDSKGRHTTVSREMVDLPNGSFIVDMPGVRGLGLWDAEAGLEAAFPDIEELTQHCRFRDCQHKDEPGCAVREAVEQGELNSKRFASYQNLRREAAEVSRQREEARRARGEKASTRELSRTAASARGAARGNAGRASKRKGQAKGKSKGQSKRRSKR